MEASYLVSVRGPTLSTEGGGVCVTTGGAGAPIRLLDCQVSPAANRNGSLSFLSLRC